MEAWAHRRDVGFEDFKISIVCTRHNVDQLDEFKALADDHGAQLRITRLRPSGRGVDRSHALRLTNPPQRHVFPWILAHPHVPTGASFLHPTPPTPPPRAPNLPTPTPPSS